MKQTLQVSLWSFRDMRLVLPARAVSLAGDSVTLVALMLRVSEHGDPAAMTALMLAFAVPLVVMIPVAGRLVDRYDSRAVLVGASLFQAGAVAGLAFADGLAATVALVCVLQLGQAVSQPGWAALMPRIVGEDLVGRAVGTSQALNGVAMLAGSAVGGLLVGWYGTRAALLVDSVTFAALALVAVAIRTRRRGTPAAEGVPRGAIAGFRVMFGDGLLKVLVPGLWIFILAAESVNVVEVFLVTDEAGLGASAYGLVLACQGAERSPEPGWRAGWRATCPGRARRVRDDQPRGRLALMGVSWHPVVLVLGSVLMGGSGGLLNAAGNALIVRRSPEAVRGQVLAALIGSARAFSIAALLLGGYAGHQLGVRGTFVAAGILSAVIGAVLGLRLGDGRGEREVGLASFVGVPGLGEADDAVAEGLRGQRVGEPGVVVAGAGAGEGGAGQQRDAVTERDLCEMRRVAVRQAYPQ